MFLKVSLFALTLCSVRAHPDPDCEELLQPSEHQLLHDGDWIVHARATTNMARFMRGIKSTWIEVQGTKGDTKAKVCRHDKVGKGQKCIITKGIHEVNKKDQTVFTYNTKPFKSVNKGIFLQTLDENVSVFWANLKLPKRSTTSIVLLAKTDHVSKETMERFYKQAQCVGFKSEHVHCPDTHDLCGKDHHEEEDDHEGHEEKEGDEGEEGGEEEEEGESTPLPSPQEGEESDEEEEGEEGEEGEEEGEEGDEEEEWDEGEEWEEGEGGDEEEEGESTPLPQEGDEGEEGESTPLPQEGDEEEEGESTPLPQEGDEEEEGESTPLPQERDEEEEGESTPLPQEGG